MRTLATLQDADSGRISLGEIDVLNDKDAVRRMLGYLPQEFGIYPRISALEMLDHLATLKGISSASDRKQVVEALLNRVNLWEHRKKAVASYSGGMRQRFGIAQALLGDPKLIIVDEPTAGLDPGERNRFYNLLSEIGESVIVILSTHIVQDVKELCSQMAIINEGRVLFAGTPDLALKEIEGKVWAKSIAKSEMEEYQNKHKVISGKLVAGKPIIHVLGDECPEGFRPAEASLEDVFFSKILQ
jgi:ABC-type multidrug transport system ATPase subunit